ncbi:hypothetical protein PsorP6_000215 [Peronosclerospora sorghi]|uniref:Uncharacterized protein n=1 Tax=Peronosclerospora sorghi TaxID=230839 RepID=A0ACC0WQ81_9STRA|nr:hypothetical protein PsorP6_000215 [Peronosclerospora sorghi]
MPLLIRVRSDREEIEVKTEWELEDNNQAPVRSVSGDTSSDETRAYGTVDECSRVWRCGVSQFLRDLRHKACIQFATENVNAVAGVIVAAMLHHSAPWEREKDEATSAPSRRAISFTCKVSRKLCNSISPCLGALESLSVDEDVTVRSILMQIMCQWLQPLKP